MKPLIGTMILDSIGDTKAVGSLTIADHRVELSLTKEGSDAWLSLIKVIGDLPWKVGEERLVEINILSKKFSQYVRNNRPDLSVSRGDLAVGKIIFT